MLISFHFNNVVTYQVINYSIHLLHTRFAYTLIAGAINNKSCKSLISTVTNRSTCIYIKLLIRLIYFDCVWCFYLFISGNLFTALKKIQIWVNDIIIDLFIIKKCGGCRILQKKAKANGLIISIPVVVTFE